MLILNCILPLMAKKKIDFTENRRLLLEFQKKLKIASFSTWRKKFTGELIVVRTGTIGYSVRRPTLEALGYKFISCFIDSSTNNFLVHESFNIRKKSSTYNTLVVRYVLNQYSIYPSKEVIYTIQWTTNGRKNVQLFYI